MKIKNKLWVLVIISLIGFIVNSCDGNDEKQNFCECNPKEHNEGEECCTGNGCNCIIILYCECPKYTIHLIGEKCRGTINCECELNVVGIRAIVPNKATNGMIITNRDGIAAGDFETMVTNVQTALDHISVSTGTRQNFIKNNIKEIKIIPTNIGANPIISDDILIIENGAPGASVRTALNVWLERLSIYSFYITYYTNGANGNNINLAFDPSSTFVLPGAGDWIYIGKTFTGWNTEADGSGIDYEEGQKIIVDNNLTESTSLILYAKWE